jgi:hypothetical protein
MRIDSCAGRTTLRGCQPARLACAALALFCLGCGGARVEPPSAAANAAQTRAKASAWSLTSKAFREGQRIPIKYTADGANASPDLEWTAPPAGIVELALICDDPDAPRGTWVHWVMYALPAALRSLPEAVPKTETLPKLGGAKQGRGSSGSVGYDGPSPPKGPTHHYYFRLYALNAKVALPPGAQRADLDRAMEGRVLAQTELMGTYSR